MTRGGCLGKSDAVPLLAAPADAVFGAVAAAHAHQLLADHAPVRARQIHRDRPRQLGRAALAVGREKRFVMSVHTQRARLNGAIDA